MESFVLIAHFFIALAIIGLVLLQQGKGAEMGASFGSGGSNTVFGSSGGLSFFAKVTAILATLFFISSFALAIMARNDSNIGATSDLPFVQESAPAVQVEEFPEIPSDEMDPEAVPADELPSAP